MLATYCFPKGQLTKGIKKKADVCTNLRTKLLVQYDCLLQPPLVTNSWYGFTYNTDCSDYYICQNIYKSLPLKVKVEKKTTVCVCNTSNYI